MVSFNTCRRPDLLELGNCSVCEWNQDEDYPECISEWKSFCWYIKLLIKKEAEYLEYHESLRRDGLKQETANYCTAEAFRIARVLFLKDASEEV
jgi:hypothetical protein